MSAQALGIDAPEQFCEDDGTDWPAQSLRSALRVPASAHGAGLEWVAEEVPVAMVYNGISHAVMLASPADLEDFGLGFSLAEGIVTRASELYDTEVHRHEAGIEVHMRISARAFEALKSRRRSLTGRTGCGLCGVDSLRQVARPVAAMARGTQHLTEAAIHRAFSQLSKRQTLHALTGAVHAAAWATARGDLLCVREDLGRHNALDKLIGAAALDDIDPSQGFVIVTSRASYEMVLKLASFGGTVLAAISAPTGLAIDLAARTGMTLCGFVRDARMVIYNDAGPFRNQ
jgi:formate dehydrogenase accessory protein FdhD